MTRQQVATLLSASSVAIAVVAVGWSFLAERSVRVSMSPMSPTPPPVVAIDLPSLLHYDLDEAVMSDLTVGNVPLSYSYVLANPGSPYTKVIRRLGALVEKYGDRFVVNFWPGELPDADLAMMAGAVCVTAQNEGYFPAYHRAALSAMSAWSVEETVAAGTTAGAESERLRDCLTYAIANGRLTSTMDPGELRRFELLSRFFADGKGISIDQVSCDRASPERMDATEMMNCLERILAKGETTQVVADEVAVERPDGARPSSPLMLLRRTTTLLKASEYRFDVYFSPTERFRVGPLEGDVYSGEVKVIGNDLYLVTTQPPGLRRVSLVDGTQSLLISSRGALGDDGEGLGDFEVIGERLYYFTRANDSPDYQPEGWRLRSLNLATGQLELLATMEKFDLYSAPRGLEMDGSGRLIVTVVGGDGGVVVRSRYAVDEAHQSLSLLKTETVVFACLDEGAEQYCTADDIRIAKEFVVPNDGVTDHMPDGCAEGVCRCDGLVVPTGRERADFVGCW